MTRIALLDYGTGNLHSLAKAMARVGEVRVVNDAGAALDAEMLVLPGVGAFGQAAREIAAIGEEMRVALTGGLPCIGVCLGMQLLFETSEESAGEGIGFIDGNVRRISAERLPQMGWNTVDWPVGAESQTPRISARLDAAYFANGFVAAPKEESCVVAWATHEGDRFPSIVRKANTVGIQFHPEKSSRAGVEFLCAVAEEVLSCR